MIRLATMALIAVTGVSVALEKRLRNDASCIMDTDGYCTEEFARVELTMDKPEVSVRINVAVGDGVSITVPPALGITEEKVVNGNGALFKVTVGDGGVTVSPHISPKEKPQLMKLAREQGSSPEDMLIGEGGAVKLHLRPWFITVDLRIAQKGEAVQFLRFSSEDLAREESRIEADCAIRFKADWDKLKKEKDKLEKRRIEHDGDAVAFQLASGGQCRSGWWTAMHDLLWVEAHRVCEVGGRIYVSFTIRNEDGSGKIFRPGRIELLNGGSDAAAIKPARIVWMESIKSERKTEADSIALSEDQSVVGTIHVPRDRVTEGKLTLLVVERGETRKVPLSGIGL